MEKTGLLGDLEEIGGEGVFIPCAVYLNTPSSGSVRVWHIPIVPLLVKE